MKNLLPFLFCLFSFIANAQPAARTGYAVLPLDSATQRVAYTAVVPAPGVSKDELFARAQAWAARSFVDSKAASRVEDKGAGTLVFHTSLASPGPENVYAFTVSLYTKEGRYKYVIDQVSRTWGVLSGGQWAAGPITKPMEYFGSTKLNKGQQAELVRFDAQMKELVKSIELALTAGGTKAKDW